MAERGLDSSRPTRVRHLVFALACATSFLLYLHRYTWAFVKPRLREEMDWSYETLGWLDSLFNASYAIGQLPSGIVTDVLGPRRILSTIIAVWSVSLAATAAAGGFAAMGAVRLVFGFAQAGCYPALSKASKLWFPLSTRATAQGWIATFFGRGGGAASNLLFGSIMLGYLMMPWRTSLLILAAGGVLFAILFALIFRDSPAQHPWANQAEADLVAAGDTAAGTFVGGRLNWRDAAKSLTLWGLLFEQFTAAFVDNMYVYWMPLFLEEQKKVSSTSAGWMAAAPLLGGAIGGMTAGFLQTWLIRRFGSRRWGRSLVGLVGGLAATVLMFVSLSAESAVAFAGLFFLVKFFSDWSQPTVWATTTDIGGRTPASVFACVNTSGSIAGFVAGPAMGGIILYFSGGPDPTEAGWTALFVVMGTIYLLSSLSWLFIDCEKPITPEGA